MKQFGRYLQIIILLVTIYVWGSLRLQVDIVTAKNNELMFKRIKQVKEEPNVDTIKAIAIREIKANRRNFTAYSDRSSYLSLILIAVIVCQLFLIFNPSVRVK